MKKISIIIIIATTVGCSLLIIVIMMIDSLTSSYSHPTFGVTFSPMYAKYLGLDFKKIYSATLNELNVKHLRIPTYWSEVEKTEGKLDFQDVDFMVSEAAKSGAKITLIVGIKQPRWPECFAPGWAKKMTIQERQQKALNFVETTVKRYAQSDTVEYWQVENEPYVSWFGEDCDPPDKDFLQKEISLVKSLDSRLVIVTDSGEWSSWIPAMKAGDFLGISLYRKAYNDKFGYITYPFFPWMYSLKSNLIRQFVPNNQKTIISELQAEPWLPKGVMDSIVSEQARLFSVKELQDNVNFAKKTGFSEIYFWGVEWWYYMAEKGRPEYLEYAKKLFK